MLRTFKIMLPADTANHNLYSLLVGSVSASNPFGYGLAQGGTDETGITGAIPSSGILPDRVGYLEIQADAGNANTITIDDRNYANTTGKVLNATDVKISGPFNKNIVCLKDYFLLGGAASQVVEVNLEVN